MTKREIKNYGRSVKERLLTLSRNSDIPYMTILVRYIHERLLYRLAHSKFRDKFLLKGGALLYAYNKDKARPTKDIDFLGTHVSNDTENIKSIFAQIITVPCKEDGILFEAGSIETEDITQEKVYHGLRLTVLASLDSVKQRISMDIGFGDIVTPGPQTIDYPLLLEDVPSVSILAYSRETVVAEKFEAMVSLSVNNSRMKDFFDIYKMLNSGKLDENVLTDAIHNTFKNRGTSYINNHPLFKEEFYNDTNRVSRWKNFLKGIKWEEDLSFGTVGQTINNELSKFWEMLKSENEV